MFLVIFLASHVSSLASITACYQLHLDISPFTFVSVATVADCESACIPQLSNGENTFAIYVPARSSLAMCHCGVSDIAASLTSLDITHTLSECDAKCLDGKSCGKLGGSFVTIYTTDFKTTPASNTPASPSSPISASPVVSISPVASATDIAPAAAFTSPILAATSNHLSEIPPLQSVLNKPQVLVANSLPTANNGIYNTSVNGAKNNVTESGAEQSKSGYNARIYTAIAVSAFILLVGIIAFIVRRYRSKCMVETHQAPWKIKSSVTDFSKKQREDQEFRPSNILPRVQVPSSTNMIQKFDDSPPQTPISLQLIMPASNDVKIPEYARFERAPCADDVPDNLSLLMDLANYLA